MFCESSIIMNEPIRKTVLTLSLWLAVTPALAEPLQFRSTLIPEAPPGARSMAAYMTIVNNSDHERVIANVTSDEFAEVQIHRSVIEDGVATMKPLDSLPVPAGDSVTLKPGGIHLMLIEPKEHYIDGELIRLIIEEADETRHALGIVVKKQYPRAEHPDHLHE